MQTLPVMPRRLLLLLVILALAPGTWLRSLPTRHDRLAHLTVTPLAPPRGCCKLGALRLVGAWQLSSKNVMFGSYSALHADGHGTLLALSDMGYYLRFPAPPARSEPVEYGQVPADWAAVQYNHDIESLTSDLRTGQAWIAIESNNVIFRFDAQGRQTGMAAPPAMKDWPHNLGAEAMVRLNDGRFIALGEGYSSWLTRKAHPGVLFAGDPTEGAKADSFTFSGPPGYRPTDMAELPDGRVLILVRKVEWPLPIRFSIRLILADPGEIGPDKVWSGTDLGELPAPALVDDYEGLAISPRKNGRVRLWMISDDNVSAFERALLLAWDLDPAALPPRTSKQKGAPTAVSTPLHSPRS